MSTIFSTNLTASLKKRKQLIMSPSQTRTHLLYEFIFLLLFTLPIIGNASNEKINPLSPTKEFTLFTAADATLLSNESEGAAAIGGNLIIGDASSNRNSQYNVTSGSFKVPNTDYPLALLVNGGVRFYRGVVRVTGNAKGMVKIGNVSSGNGFDAVTIHERDRNGAALSVRITKQGEAYDQNTAAIELPGNAHLLNLSTNPIQSTPNAIINFPDAFETLKANSVKLAELTGTVTLDGSRLKVLSSANDQNNDPYIWNTDAATLSRMNELNLSFTPTAERPLIINVSTGPSMSFRVFNMNGFTPAILPYVLWNFPQLTSLAISSGNTIEGSILAPLANVRKDGANNIQGQVVVNSYYQSTGELHNFAFKGLIQFPQDTPVPSVPREVDFEATNGETVAKLKWETTHDKKSDYFIIERSSNSKDWQEVGHVPSKRGSGDIVSYSYDDYIALLSFPNLYYRIRIVDIDNETEYTHIESLSFQTLPNDDDDEQPPLPVTLVAFTVQNEQGMTQINWETSEEVNSDYFVVERSSDSKNWQEVGRIEGAGNVVGKSMYTFSDNDFRLSSATTWYYRLKMIDMDGSYEYSRIESISVANRNKASFTTSFYPNPVTDRVFVKNESSAAIQLIELYDLAGQRQLAKENTSEIDVQHLREGVYIIAATYDNGQRQSSRIVIKK